MSRAPHLPPHSLPSTATSLPRLEHGRRLHIVEGRPWRKALVRLAEGDVSGRRPWHGAKDCGDRDLLLTVLSTDPRMVVSVEVADGEAANPGNTIVVRPAETFIFSQGILFDALKARSGINIQLYRDYHEAEAHAILAALADEYHLDEPWFTPDRWLAEQGITF